MGGAASFYCMQMLKKIHDFSDYSLAGKCINDVMIWAGAYIIDLSK